MISKNIIKSFFITLYYKHLYAYSRKYYFLSVISGFILWQFAIRYMFQGGSFAESIPYTPSAHDLLLDYLPTIDMNWISTYGIEWAIKFSYIYTLVFLPKRIPFMIKAFAMFKVFRGSFIVLLHVGHPFGMIPDGFANVLGGTHYLTKDLFFSGHTGYTFLAVFIFWDIKFLRYLFIISAVLIGSTTLFMHDHYTIDVLAAFPITFTAFIVTKELFKSDWLAYKEPGYQEKEPGFLSLTPYPDKNNKFDRNMI